MVGLWCGHIGAVTKNGVATSADLVGRAARSGSNRGQVVASSHLPHHPFRVPAEDLCCIRRLHLEGLPIGASAQQRDTLIEGWLGLVVVAEGTAPVGEAERCELLAPLEAKVAHAGLEANRAWGGG